MISNTNHKSGDRVIYIGSSDNGDGIPNGTEGFISHVDAGDKYMTYKVQFPHKEWSVWVDNKDLVAVTVEEDTEHCGWRDRALKAEKELKELKEALKTLSEG